MQVEFLGRLAAGNRLTVPVEVVEAAELERGEMMKVRIQVEESSPAGSYLRY